MEKLWTVSATLGIDEQQKIVWEYELTEHLFGQAPLTGKSERSYDREEEAALDMLKTLRYVLSGETD